MIGKVPFHTSLSHYVYAAFIEDSNSCGFVKFGFSCNFLSRINTLKTGCPLPIKQVAVIEVRTEEAARQIEAALHKRFKSRRTSGEWFEFDFKDPSDKKDFNVGCRAVFLLELGRDKWWKVYSRAQINAFINDSRPKKKKKKFTYTEAALQGPRDRDRLFRALLDYSRNKKSA